MEKTFTESFTNSNYRIKVSEMLSENTRSNNSEFLGRQDEAEYDNFVSTKPETSHHKKLF